MTMRALSTAIASALAALALAASSAIAQEVVFRRYTVADGLGHNSVTRVFQDSRGFLWFATADGLSRFDGHRFVTFRVEHGIPKSLIAAIGETRGTLWVAGRSGTIVRANDQPDAAPFVPHADTVGPFVARVAAAGGIIDRRLFEHRGSTGSPLVVRGTNAVVTDLVEDRAGNLWIATSGSGLFVVPAERIVNYTAADELPDEHVLRIVESRDGRIYAMTRRGGVAELRDDGVDALAGSIFAPFHTIGRRIAQDEHGAWWLWTDAGTFIAPGPGLSFRNTQRVAEPSPPPPDTSGAALVDSRGWAWAALRGGGVSVCKDGLTAQCVDYTKADGLGPVVTSIAEDAFGRVYVGTTKGLFRFDAGGSSFSVVPTIGRLAGSSITHCIRDSRDRIWIATTSGVSLIVPRRPSAVRAPQVYVTALHVGGKEIALPPRGAVAAPSVKLDTPADLRIEYASPGFEGEGTLRYQHRISGIDNAWSRPTAERTTTYSRLAPGSYELALRAVTSSGNGGPPATVPIAVPRPMWARWWWPLGALTALLFGSRALRELQRAHGRRDLAGMPLPVLGGVEQQAENGGGQPGAPYGSWLRQR